MDAGPLTEAQWYELYNTLLASFAKAAEILLLGGQLSAIPGKRVKGLRYMNIARNIQAYNEVILQAFNQRNNDLALAGINNIIIWYGRLVDFEDHDVNCPGEDEEEEVEVETESA